MSVINRVYVDDLIDTYFEMGCNALEQKQYAIAQKMFKAVFDEPSSKIQKERLMLPLLIKSAETHEGLKQLYKAKLLYIRALAQRKKLGMMDDMQSVDIMLRLANLTARQGLYKQAVDFAIEAHEAYRRSAGKEPIEFVKGLRPVENVMLLKGRAAEREKLLSMLQNVKNEALQTIPNIAGFVPSVSLAVSM